MKKKKEKKEERKIFSAFLFRFLCGCAGRGGGWVIRNFRRASKRKGRTADRVMKVSWIKSEEEYGG